MVTQCCRQENRKRKDLVRPAKSEGRARESMLASCTAYDLNSALMAAGARAARGTV